MSSDMLSTRRKTGTKQGAHKPAIRWCNGAVHPSHALISVQRTPDRGHVSQHYNGAMELGRLGASWATVHVDATAAPPGPSRPPAPSACHVLASNIVFVT